jgi:ABC-type Fe3+/spermidine/putrescine transport system ATPase subunit
VAAYGSDGTLEITAPAGTAGTLPALRPGGDAGKALRPGDEAVLAIRPTGVRLASLTDGSPHLTGRVADVAFRGRGYEYAIDVPGLGRLAGVFARDRATRGDEVGLRLEPGGCHLFPADDSGTSAVKEYASA